MALTRRKAGEPMPGNEPEPAWSRQNAIREQIAKERESNAKRKRQESPQEIAKREVRRESQIIELSRTATQPNTKAEVKMGEGEASAKSARSGIGETDVEATPGGALEPGEQTTTGKSPDEGVDLSVKSSRKKG